MRYTSTLRFGTAPRRSSATTILSARLLSCRGRVQREGDVIHVVAHALTDLTPLLHRLGQRDEARSGGAGDARPAEPRLAPTDPRGRPALSVRTRDFR